MWNGEAFDIQRKGVSKGESLETMLKILAIEKDEVIAIGDRINDKELLDAAGIGVSADRKVLPAKYWTIGYGLPGEALTNYLLGAIK